jgi:hypothetical protein
MSSILSRKWIAVSPSSRSGRDGSFIRIMELASEPPTVPFEVELCLGDDGSPCRNLPSPNRLLKLVRPAVEVEFLPVGSFAKGGVGGLSSDPPLFEPSVEDLSRSFPSGGISVGEDLLDLFEFVLFDRNMAG